MAERQQNAFISRAPAQPVPRQQDVQRRQGAVAHNHGTVRLPPSLPPSLLPPPSATHVKKTRQGLGSCSAVSLTSTCSGSAVVPLPPSMHRAALSQEASTLAQSMLPALGSTTSMRSCSWGWLVPAGGVDQGSRA